jgi:hypothetical protein
MVPAVDVPAGCSGHALEWARHALLAGVLLHFTRPRLYDVGPRGSLTASDDNSKDHDAMAWLTRRRLATHGADVPLIRTLIETRPALPGIPSNPLAPCIPELPIAPEEQPSPLPRYVLL